MQDDTKITTGSTHTLAVTRCARILRSRGINLARANYYRDGHDLIAEGRVRIAVRHATARLRKGKLYRRVDGSISVHPYLRWTFNFHRHGKLDRNDRYCEFFVCMLDGTARGQRTTPVFVIPWDRVTALTFSSSLREGSTRSYNGRYAPYLDAWHLIVNAAAGGLTASTTRRGRPVVTARGRISSKELPSAVPW